MMRVQHINLSLLFGLLLVFGACSKDEQSGSKKQSTVKPIPEDEAKRGEQACQAYTERACECAKTKPELAEECELSKAMPGALKLNLDGGRATGLSDVELEALKVSAQKIIAGCFESMSKLDVTCPRSE
jgi:hypothetical protein